ncbi:MAG: hypothetical protein LBP23_08850 [Treponema sp.]|jgi:hypothetical protein|nr:hypothetical protein [Treponema sp.]
MKIIAGFAQSNIKKIALWLFILLPVIAHTQPQYLEPEDVDILINNWDIIDSVVAEEGKTEEETPEWDAFNERGLNVVNHLEEMGNALENYSGDTGMPEEDPAGFEEFKRSYDKFMNGTAPSSLQRSFDSIGWGKRGLQKMFTLLFGMTFVVLHREALQHVEDETDAGYLARTLEVIHQSDLKIIEDNLERIAEFMSK